MLKAKPNPVTDDDAREFGRYLQRWRDRLNLRDWRVQLQAKRDPVNVALLYKADVSHRLAKIKVGTDFGENTPVTPYTLEHFALHEMLHLFFTPLIEAVIAEREHNETVLGVEHAAIIVLTDLLMDAYGENRRPTP